jgi:hypothetical protein
MSKFSDSIFERLKDENYRKSLITSLSTGIDDKYIKYFNKLINYVIDEKLYLFDKPEFIEPIHKDEDKAVDLILPAIRRVFAKIFIQPPSIYSKEFNLYYEKNANLRYKLFVLYFDIDYFIDYLYNMLIKSKDKLSHLEYIDGTVETLNLIIDNYIGYNIKRVSECDDIESEVKNIKRDSILKDILNI